MSNQGHSLAYTADGIGVARPGEPWRGYLGTCSQNRKVASPSSVAACRRRRGSILDAVLGEARTLGDQLGQEDRGSIGTVSDVGARG